VSGTNLGTGATDVLAVRRHSRRADR
jgi:hypothetical protein